MTSTQGRSDAKNPRGENEFLENPRGAKPKKSSFSVFFSQKYQNSRGAKGARGALNYAPALSKL